ncbi:cell division protein FtsH, partial [Clostridium perfringens]|nr:cell division protein FtsH [Clostridium perfringens]
MKKYSSATVWIFVILILFLSATFLWNSGKMADEISYSDFQQKWVNDEIESVMVHPDKMIISGKTTSNKQFTT